LVIGAGLAAALVAAAQRIVQASKYFYQPVGLCPRCLGCSCTPGCTSDHVSGPAALGFQVLRSSERGREFSACVLYMYPFSSEQVTYRVPAIVPSPRVPIAESEASQLCFKSYSVLVCAYEMAFASKVR
jgi:hypothetical protein